MTLLTSWKCKGEVHLVIGGSNASALRINSACEAGANVKVICEESLENLPITIRTTFDLYPTQVELLNKKFDVQDLTTLGRPEVANVVDKVFVSLPISEYSTKKLIYDESRKLRIPVNVSDSPELCTFTLLSTFTSGDFQLGVSTNGKGCKLASRIKRELAATLPQNIGEVCNKVGELRKRIQEEDQLEETTIGEHDDDAVHSNKLNALVEEFNMTKEQNKLQRTKWLSQIVEYFPLSSLLEISLDDLTNAYKNTKIEMAAKIDSKVNSSGVVAKKGKISLVGSGPGSVSLLTLGALQEIYSADLILADKLVPQQVLDLIPRQRTKLFIARKFPGNAERAQEELLSLGLEALQNGEKVVRLKQGDPYIFGRGGEEYNFFAEHGFVPQVLPGITLALAAPVLSNIPATHREVADQVLICTGTGRRGALPNLPEFVKSRTTVFLMSLHRVVDLIPNLIKEKGWDPELPVAVVERASCPDQRIIRTRLGDVAEAVEANGSRPPGLLVTGYACEVIEKAKIEGNSKWTVEEGWNGGHSNFNPLLELIEKVQEK